MSYKLSEFVSKINAVDFIFVAFLTVATQLQSKELMQMIIGQTLQGEVFVVATAFTGFLIGLSIRINRQLKTFLYSFAAVFGAALCLFYEQVAEHALIYFPLGIFVFLMCALSIVLAAIMLAEAVYSPKFELNRYIQIQKFAFYSAAAVLVFTFFADKQIVYFLMALSFSGAALLSLEEKQAYDRQPLKANRNSFEAILWGCASGCATNYFFNFYHSMIYPTGLEFHFYILILFLFLYVSALLYKKYDFKIRLFEGYVAAAGILFVATTAVVLTNFAGNFYFDPLKLTMSSVFSYYPIFIFLIIVILMSPYLIISFTVPILQSENETANHMFFTTLGSCFIQYLFLVPIFNIPLQGRFYFLVGFLILAYLVQSKSCKRKVTLSFCLLLLISLASLMWPQLENRLVVQARRFHSAYWLPADFRGRMIKQGNAFREPDILKRVGSKVGALGGHHPNLKMLTLDGYSAETYLPHDYIKALISARAIEGKKPKRILLLGLGNHIVLQKLVQVVNLDVKIDVVDNSLFFADPLFLKAVADEAGFSWPVTQVELHTEDALHFMYRSKDRYDLIVWNLTLPNYIDSLPLFSSQFAVQMKNHLSSEGTLILPFYQNSHFDCVSAGLYQKIEIFKTSKPLSISIFTAGHQAPDPRMRIFNESCNGVRKISFASQFQDRSFNLHTIKHEDLPAQFSELFVTAEDIEPVQNLNQSTIIEVDNAKPSLIFNAPFKSFDRSAILDFTKAMRDQKFFSVGWLDNNAQKRQFLKINSIFNYFLKDQTTVVQISPDFSTRASQLRNELKSYELVTDDVLFWKNVSKKIVGDRSFFVDGNTFLMPHVREVIEINHLGPVKQGDYNKEKVIIFAVDNDEELKKLMIKHEQVIKNKNAQLVVWFPPWSNVSAVKNVKIFAQIRWQSAKCEHSFWKYLIDQIYLHHPAEKTRSFVISVEPVNNAFALPECRPIFNIRVE